ncbi:MAG: hypothetical protein HYV75_04920 [Opitutae bacterium]|nr:hypothetical protein [Opitutae bacterium]
MRAFAYPILFILILGMAGCGSSNGLHVDLQIHRSFHRPLQFEIRETDGTIILRTIIRAGKGGYDHGPVAQDYTRKLTPTEASALAKALRATLASPPGEAYPPGGRDGSVWIFDVRGERRIRWKVWTPDSRPTPRGTQQLHALGLLLFRLARITEPESDFY